MRIVYTGPQPEWSQYVGAKQISFKAYTPVEVDDDLGAKLIARSDFEIVAEAGETDEQKAERERFERDAEAAAAAKEAERKAAEDEAAKKKADAAAKTTTVAQLKK